jgi:hydroxyacylglutathione hydrolase
VIIEKLVVGPLATNCYIVGDDSSRKGVIIDPGADEKRIIKRADELSLDIKLILLTHGHIDHTGALKKLKNAIGVEVAVHADDADLAGYRSSGSIFGLFYPSPPPPDRLLKDNEILDIGGMHFRVLHTPGHTPGGICLLVNGALFSGDTLFKFGIGRSDLPGGNHSRLLESIRSRLLVLDDAVVVYPGHGENTTIANERKSNPFLIGKSFFK